MAARDMARALEVFRYGRELKKRLRQDLEILDGSRFTMHPFDEADWPVFYDQKKMGVVYADRG